MAPKFLAEINTYSLMTIVLFFSYIYDSIKTTYSVPSSSSSRLPKAAQASIEVENDDESKVCTKMAVSGSQKGEEEVEEIMESPLAKMPTILRLYSYFSTASHIFISSKYILLSIVKYHLIPNLDWVACYLPGRVSFLDDLAYELPGLAIMMSSCHLVWRSMWYLIYKKLSLESLIFIVCDDELLESKRKELKRKFQRSNWLQREQMYQLNRMFCQKIQTPQGQVDYLMRQDRDLARKRTLASLVRSVTVVMLMNTIIFGTPLSIFMLFNILSHDFFELNYQGCKSLSAKKPPESQGFNLTTDPQVWTFSDPYRMGMFVADAFDNFMILFDSASGLTWPLVTSTIVALDLTISMDEISHRIRQIDLALVDLGANNTRNKQKPPIKSALEKRSITTTLNTRRLAQLNDDQALIEMEVVILQSDIMIVFDNVRKVDRYINAFAAYAIIFWVVINVTYEVLYVSRRQEYSLNSTVVWLQTAALVLLTFTFAHLGRTHSKTVRLYHTCCNLMARDPFIHSTKPSWIYLLEYYHQQKSLYSLHMGWTVLTFTNYIQFMLYSITFSMILINLLRQQFI